MSYDPANSTFRLARKEGDELAYSFTTESECLAVPAYDGIFIIEKNVDLPNGWRTAYFGTGNAQAGTGTWNKFTAAQNG